MDSTNAKPLKVNKMRASYDQPAPEDITSAVNWLRDTQLSPNCLEPHEIEGYWAAGDLPPERAEHVMGCALCAGVLPEAHLDEEPLRVLVSRALAACYETEAIHYDTEPVSVTEQREPAVVTPDHILQEGLADSLGPVLVFVTLAILLSRVGLFSPGYSEPVPLLLAVASAIGALLLGKRYGLTKRHPILYHSLPTITAGLILAAWSLFWFEPRVQTAFDRERAQQPAPRARHFKAKAKEYAEARLTERLIESIGNKRQGGDFLKLPTHSGPFNTTSKVSQYGATYEQSAVGLPGTLTAHIQATGGQLVWQGSNAPEERRSLTLGQVRLDNGKLELIDSGGKTLTLKTQANVLLPTNGSYVAVTFDTKTKTALVVRELSSPSTPPTAPPSEQEH